MSTKIAAPEKAIWEIAFSRPDYSAPIVYGVESLVDGSGTKFYRAFSLTTLGGEQVRRESDTYLANDKADPDFSTGEMRFQGPGGREQLVFNAALVRGAMSPQERSPRDMEALAMEMHQAAQTCYHQWERDEEARRARQVDDEAARQLMRQWLRGAELLMADGDEAALAFLRRVLTTPKR